ncbi:50S ribosomal protein L4 [Guggenheimella bovis]
MPTIKMINQAGQQVGDLQLSDEIFGIEPNEYVVQEAVVNYLANQRQGTFSAKTRSDVSGGGRKPFRQKGNGRARQGSIRAPQWVGGGINFAKKPRDFSYRLPKKIRRLALKSVLSQKVLDGALIVVDKLELEEAKTKNMVKVLSDMGIDKKALFIIGEENVNVERAVRNIPKTLLLHTNTMNTYEIINHPLLVLTKEALEKIEEVYK